jgi:hypothetical protein
MKTKSDSGLRLTGMNAKVNKAPYQAPVLRVYGAVNQLTAGGGSHNGEGGSMKPSTSDRAVKENIVRVGTHPLGIGLYLFNYMPEFRETAGFGRQFGVMADEVETVLPQAVVMHPDGYKRVDYALLGIDVPGQTVH